MVVGDEGSCCENSWPELLRLDYANNSARDKLNCPFEIAAR